MQTQEAIRSRQDRDPSQALDGQVRDAMSGVSRPDTPQPTVAGARTEVDAALEAVDQPKTDATTADKAPQPGHVEIAGRVGVQLYMLREALLNAVNGE
jgi:hypothetical protein